MDLHHKIENVNDVTWMVGRDSLQEPSAVMLDLSERLQAFMMLATVEGLKIKEIDFKHRNFKLTFSLVNCAFMLFNINRP